MTSSPSTPAGGLYGIRENKYRAVPTVVDGIRFASKAEARRYMDLKLLERGREIWGLRCQVPFPLMVNGVKVGTYVADFLYVDQRGEHCEDVKGISTPVFKLKRRIFEAQYNREIEIIGGMK